ncbi:MAG: sulfur carrier protein ThiS [Bacteroidales bacterium]|nr:sulfur carrier protein ThiS [Bacteroidales bacterium]MBK9356526.1 sulfur carrier protein ThiS [Bacteroidales bacterium]
MKITLNNREEEFGFPELTITRLMAEKNFTFRMLVVKVNGELVKRHEFDHKIVRDGDDVMILHLITGG